mgnify:FL=1
MTWTQTLKLRAAKAVAAGTAVLTILSLSPAAAFAGDVTFSADTTVTLSATGESFTIASGSTADSVAVGTTTITVIIGDSGDEVTISSANNISLDNAQGFSPCATVGDDPTIVIDFVGTTIVTPSSTCASGGGGGGGGGGGSSSSSSSTISVDEPGTDDVLTGGMVTTIEWDTSGSDIESVTLELSVDGGDSFATIVESLDASDGSYDWTVTNTTTEEGVVRAKGYDEDSELVDSDEGGTFTIELDEDLPEEEVVTDDDEVMTREEANAALPGDVEVDNLVKGSTSSAVYYVGLDAKRHPFPNEQIFYTWYPDFDEVVTVSDTDLAAMTIGTPILTRPGTLMVKIQTDPKTYAVEPGYNLRWVTSEDVAIDLYGSTWNQMIMDIEPTYFSKFSFGDDLESGDSHPSAALVTDASGGDVYFIDGEGRRLVEDDAAFEANMFQSRFVLVDPGGVWTNLGLGDVIAGFEDELFSEQLF